MSNSLRYSLWSILVLTIMLVLAACGRRSNGPTEIGVTDAGKTVVVVLNNQVIVTLDGNPTTGYIWEVAPDSTTALKQNGQYEFKASSGAMGAGGQLVFKFDVSGVGEGKLKMMYHRPFEKGVPPIQTFEVTINAVASATSGY